jgi:xanthine dehydrogenase accessory factor
MLELLNQIVTRCRHGETVAVCTLVRTHGSTPQKSGAVLVVLSDGKTLGTIGGGCVEAEVRTRALRQMPAGGSRLFTFQLDHDHGWDDGLVCGGTMDVVVQVLSSSDQIAGFEAALQLLNEGKPANLVITARSENGKHVEFNQPIEPAPTLVIAGAGHVASALAVMGRLMEFSLTVIDDRPEFASIDRFPGATICIGDVETKLSELALTPQSYVVIVTRGHRRDAAALAAVIRLDARYIGLIGSRRKVIKIFSDLHEQGVTREQLSRVHAPIGLNIGAVTPAEIAVSIAAELTAIRRKSPASSDLAMRLNSQLLDRVFAAPVPQTDPR